MPSDHGIGTREKMDYSKCWLDYQPVEQRQESWLTLSVLCEGQIVDSAVKEYSMAMKKMTGNEPITVTDDVGKGVQFVIDEKKVSGRDGYRITGEEDKYVITGQSESGVLYGVFHFLR